MFSVKQTKTVSLIWRSSSRSSFIEEFIMDDNHQHYWYVFSIARPIRKDNTVGAPLCPTVDEIMGSKFQRVFEGRQFCTYVCAHEKTTAACHATISCKVDVVSALRDLNGTRLSTIFQPLDFDCVTDGKVVPLSFVEKLITKKDAVDAGMLKEEAHSMAFYLKREHGRNDLMEQLVATKIGPQFKVSRSPMTQRKGDSFNPFSHSRQDLCIFHKTNGFRLDGSVVTGIVGSTTTDVIEADLINTGDVEFKKSQFAVDQTLAEMLCTLTDYCVEELKNGKQVKNAIVYGLAINYEEKSAQVLKVTLDFVNKCSVVKRLKDKVMICDGLNFLIAALSNTEI